MKKWECTVCGYIHTGNEPPEKCPVCGADKSQFVEIVAEEDVKTETNQTELETKKEDLKPLPSIFNSKLSFLFDLMIKHHVHPISVHIPNGVLPVSVIFVVLASVFNFAGLSQAAFYNLIFVVLTMPMVLFSGYIGCQKKYNGSLTKLFLTKMICGGIVSLTAIILVVWLYIDPQVVNPSSSYKWAFLFINFVMLAAAGVAGFLGGKLVFKD